MARRISASRWSSASSSASSKAKKKPAETQAQEPDASTLFGCLLIKQFPIWAAHYINPALAAAPLIIHRRGKVYAASAEVLTAGVRIGWILQRAQSLCPQAAIKPHNPHEESYAWDEVLAALYTLTPRLEFRTPGLLFFEPPSPKSESWITTLGALAKLVRTWCAQAALACDRATAELAACLVSPGGVRQVKNARGFLQSTPSAALAELGLSAVATERVGWFGLKSVADLTRLSREQIQCQFADPTNMRDAALLWRFARAGTPDADCQAVQTYQLPPVRLSRVAFEQAATCPGEWERALSDAVEQASAQLNGMGAGALTVSLETKAGARQASKILREPVSAPRNLYRVALDLMKDLVSDSVEIQSLEVRLSRLKGHGNQTTLFDTRRYDSSSRRDVPPNLLSALRNLESRFVGSMWKYKLQDQYAPLPEERSVLVPAFDEFP